MQNLRSLSDWLEWQEQLHPESIELGLERVQDVWQRLHPESFSPYVISIAGTNGKGSCVAYLDAILRAASYVVGTYTSPHLLRYNERIHLDGREASDEELIAAFERIEAVRGDIQLTYFEYGTLAALELFASHDVDVAVLEVGLGGRLDAVNILDADAALVTSIGLDHQNWLGDNKDSIGYEKAGILRSSQPAVFAESDVPDGFLQAANSSGADISYAVRDYSWKISDCHWSFDGATSQYQSLPLPAIEGRHQVQNAAAVLMLLSKVVEHLPVSQQALEKGLVSAKLSGRFQIIDQQPQIILDVAHNHESALALHGNLVRLTENGKNVAIFSMYADKPVEAVVETMDQIIAHWYLYPLENPRAMTIDELERRVSSVLQHGSYSIHSSLNDAWQHACKACSDTDRLVAFGSFEVVGAALERLQEDPDCET